ncbi:MAG: P-type conjugative transfer protein TrbJ [Alphaproteobacteria bacterium]|nr:P-type conjugative transfer protein TrbJ [Alphaproteobacteria bacterium]
MKCPAIAVFAVAAVLGVATPGEAQFFGSSIVFDPTNYAQNVLTAARELQQVNNEIEELQNEAVMLQNMGKNLASLPTSQLSPMISALTQISSLMNQGSGIAFNVASTNAAWNNTFPASYAVGTPTATIAANASSRWQQAMAGFQQALQIQSQIVQSVQSDAATLSNLVGASQGAVGNLEVSQATNQLLALSTKQQLQIQDLMAAQYRASALESARNAEEEAAAQSEFTTFIGNGQAYTPQ